MSRINSRAKGASGERQFCKWLADNLDISDAERNLEQVRSGGADIIVIGFVFEVKRVQGLNIADAWRQCAVAARAINSEDSPRNYREPVLAHRENGKPWAFCISATHIGLDNGFVMLNERNFREWALRLIEERYL